MEQPRDQSLLDPTPSDGMTYQDGSTIRHIVVGLSEFMHSPRQWWLARRMGGTALGETVGPDGITVVARGSEELTYIDDSFVRRIGRIGQHKE